MTPRIEDALNAAQSCSFTLSFTPSIPMPRSPQIDNVNGGVNEDDAPGASVPPMSGAILLGAGLG